MACGYHAYNLEDAPGLGQQHQDRGDASQTASRRPHHPNTKTMCGIFLALERYGQVNTELARAATSSLRHRGPDGIGESQFQWTATPGQGAAVHGFVGHTRLSIIDPIERSSQPFRRGQKTLTYNGEIYNYRSLRSELARSGAQFQTDGDTEVLLELLIQGGVQSLNRANGIWAFCLVDQANGRLTAARDRYGKKPLFYYRDALRLCVASEIAPILTYLGQRPSMVTDTLDTFLRDGWLFPDPDGATHIQGIRQVPAGHGMAFDLASWDITLQAYFDLQRYASSTPPGDEELAHLIQDAVLSRLVADRRVGLLLSGGVDSSLILSVLHANGLADQVSCFTGDAGKSDDALYARQSVEQLGIRAINVALDYGSRGMEGFLRVCRHQEKPFPLIGNVLAMPQLYASMAEHDVPVVLDGTGGDELFAGYWDRYYRFALEQARLEGDRAWIEASLAENSNNSKAQAAWRRVSAGVANSPGQARLPTLLTGSGDPVGLEALLHPDVLLAPANDPLEAFSGSLGQALTLDASRGRLPEWLWQNDRNAMMSGIENRSPLLDFRLAPYMHSAWRKKFVGPWNKHELRTLFSGFTTLPTQWRRNKQGFRWVYHQFLRNNRKAVLELVAASSLLPPRVDVKAMLDLAHASDDYLECGLLQRMLCIAGLENTMGLMPA